MTRAEAAAGPAERDEFGAGFRSYSFMDTRLYTGGMAGRIHSSISHHFANLFAHP